MAELIDRLAVYETACRGCTRHGNEPGECYHDEPCEKLIFAFTTAAVVDAVEVVRCKDCKHGEVDDPDFPDLHYCHCGHMWNDGEHFCADGERRTDG